MGIKRLTQGVIAGVQPIVEEAVKGKRDEKEFQRKLDFLQREAELKRDMERELEDYKFRTGLERKMKILRGIPQEKLGTPLGMATLEAGGFDRKAMGVLTPREMEEQRLADEKLRADLEMTKAHAGYWTRMPQATEASLRPIMERENFHRDMYDMLSQPYLDDGSPNPNYDAERANFHANELRKMGAGSLPQISGMPSASAQQKSYSDVDVPVSGSIQTMGAPTKYWRAGPGETPGEHKIKEVGKTIPANTQQYVLEVTSDQYRDAVKQISDAAVKSKGITSGQAMMGIIRNWPMIKSQIDARGGVSTPALGQVQPQTSVDPNDPDDIRKYLKDKK